MKRTAILALLLIAACDSGTEQELASLRADLASQRTEIERLSVFVDAQAAVLTICQNAMVQLTDYLINTNAIGMLREAGLQFAHLGECTGAIDRFNAIATAAGIAKKQEVSPSTK